MRYFIWLCCLFFMFNTNVTGQSTEKNPKPKLVVGIVVDQMSYDLLYRFWEHYETGGFKRLVQGGFSCENNHFNYMPTYTGPGHASIYTGTVPAVHGIVGNNWYNRSTQSNWYCTQDTLVKSLGTTTSAGMMSPRNMLTTTITDQLKLATNNRAKVIGISLKDRGAILPAGHTADAAYWFDGPSNAWISSTWYMDQLPSWVQTFNSKNMAADLLKDDWNLLLPAAAYTHSTADNVPWETIRTGETAPVFPHKTSLSTNMESIKGTPFGNTLTTAFAKEAIQAEELGKDYTTDFLCISYSSPDYIGHAYGPYSMEIEDTYIRLDRDLAGLLTYLDQTVGEGNYLVFLTADHGVAPTPGYMQSLGVPAGVLNETQIQASMEALLDETWGQQNWIEHFINQQIYLNDTALKSTRTTAEDIWKTLRPWAYQQEGIGWIHLIESLGQSNIPALHRDMFIQGIFPKRSGDILLVYEPNWFEYSNTGSSHGSHFAYDTQVPLLWYGWKIKPGKSWQRTSITDIAPTLAAMLKIAQPNGTTGRVIDEIKP